MSTLLESICYLTKEVIKGDVSYYFIVCSLDHVSNSLIGVSLSEPHHMIWPLEMVPWSMRETNAIRNGVDRYTCCPL